MSTALNTRAAPRHIKPVAQAGGMVLWAGADPNTVDTDVQLSWGTGAPNHTAPQGSVYIRTDASDGLTLLYLNTDGAATWATAIGQELTDLLAAANTWALTQTFTTGVATNTVSERTAGSGVTIDGYKVKDGKPVIPQHVVATVAAADATGGSTNSAFTLSLTTADGVDLVALAQVMVIWTTAQYGAELPNSHVTFASATTGSIVASGNGWALVQTDAAGDFACTCANSSDETLYVAACVPWAGSSTPGSTPWTVQSNSDAATWSA